MPHVLYEIGVCLTVTVIAALAAFDIVYVSTAGGPGNSTAVPGIQIYILAFTEQRIGLASALAIMLTPLVLVVILPIQRVALMISTMAAFAIGLLRISGSRFLLPLFVFGLTLPFSGIIFPLYYLERAMGIYNTRLAIALPLTVVC